MRTLGARGGELERDFPFGIVRQLLSRSSSTRACAHGCSRARRERRRRRSGRTTRGAARTSLSSRAFAVLHGLFWLTVNLCSEQPLLLAVDDQVLVRQCLVAVSRLSGAAAGRPSGRARREPAVFGARGRSGDTRADQQATRTVLIPDSHGSGDRDRARPVGRGRRAAFATACHFPRPTAILFCSTSSSRRSSQIECPDEAHVRIVAELEAESGLESGAAPACPALGGRRAGRAGDLRPGRRGWIAIVAKLARAPAVAAATRELVQAEILRPEPPLTASCTARAGGGLPRPRARRRGCARARGRASVRTRRSGGRSPPRTCLAIPAGGEDWVVDVLRAAADAAVAKGDLDAAISLLRRALDEPPRPDARRELLPRAREGFERDNA